MTLDDDRADEGIEDIEGEDHELMDPGDIREPKFSRGNDPIVPIGDGTELNVNQILNPLIDEKAGQVILGRSSSAHKRWGKRGTLEVGAVGERMSAVEVGAHEFDDRFVMLANVGFELVE